MNKVDFFVSYTSADRPWAEWIAWQLESEGYTVVIQAWDYCPGSNFVLEMDVAARQAKRTIAVLSPAFLESRYCSAEWAAAFREDPTGSERKLVPVRVRECTPSGLLGQVVYVDVVGLRERAASKALLDGVAARRAKPASAPTFPDVEIAGTRLKPPEAGAAIFSVPVTTRTFVGRVQQLELLAEGLTDSGTVAITGMGGVGKSQLAACYARKQRGVYDVIWWLRAEQSQTLHADLAALAVRLGLVEASDIDEQDAVTEAYGWLERNARWLVVFDNAPDPDAIANLVPEGSAGHVLITSRMHADWRALKATPLALDVWDRAESRRFLTARTDELSTK
ncbi:MAG: TIR domain-containing protein, partial [Actinobacteria bacterium]|nr:TIR domain-containing protein [Actinomycetota bacterium]